MDYKKVLDVIRIHNESLFELEKDVTNFPSESAEAYVLKAQASKEVARLSLKLEIITAEIVKEIYAEADSRSKPIASSTRGEVRRTMVPLDTRYTTIKRQLIDAISDKETLEGLAKSWEAKGYMLKELVKLSERTHFNEPIIYGRRNEEERIEKAQVEVEELLEY